MNQIQGIVTRNLDSPEWFPRSLYFEIFRSSELIFQCYAEIQVSLAVRGGYVPENCREWQNRERQDVSSMRIVGLRS